jgi:putative restriction endonuclease
MAFGVFIHRADTIYDDSPAEQYQFPKQYLSRAQALVGGWVLYYEPTKISGTRGYFAVAQVRDIVPDPGAEGMYLALIDPVTYLEFPEPVAFVGNDGPIERGLLNDAGRISGRAQAAVRPISPADFNRIVGLGLAEDAAILPRRDANAPASGLGEDPAPYIAEPVERPRVEQLTSRLVRDRVFRRLVVRAYDQRCAVTGLRLINGGGRAEVEAAHIRPVEANGPDILANGLALSGTAHWMFDRGLISVADDFAILISRQVNDQDSVRAMVNRDGRIRVPERVVEWPHPQFLRWHRETCFKG